MITLFVGSLDTSEANIKRIKGTDQSPVCHSSCVASYTAITNDLDMLFALKSPPLSLYSNSLSYCIYVLGLRNSKLILRKPHSAVYQILRYQNFENILFYIDYPRLQK